MRKLGVLLLLLCPAVVNAQGIYEVNGGSVSFHSDAPKELISASSTGLKGIIDLEKKTFAFKIGIGSFMGFNSPLQREHFNENYMETTIFPEATFSGKIIEDIDLTKDGTYVIRAKGKMRIHGVDQERIIRSTIVSDKGRLSVKSDFAVLLSDHNIKIPKLVNNKLAPEISVSVNATLRQRDK
ncbi:MAG TPA: YceI family protein [Flavipsychrobacter sp.]|nr:YceI family protein [Flavipsychrobacter sp.]